VLQNKQWFTVNSVPNMASVAAVLSVAAIAAVPVMVSPEYILQSVTDSVIGFAQVCTLVSAVLERVLAMRTLFAQLKHEPQLSLPTQDMQDYSLLQEKPERVFIIRKRRKRIFIIIFFYKNPFRFLL